MRSAELLVWSSARLLDRVRPDPDEAREWLRRELMGRAYQPSLLERVTSWFNDLLDKIMRSGQGFSDLGLPVLVGLAVLLVAVLVFVLSRLQRNPLGAGDGAAVFDDVRRTAAEHRRLAGIAFDGEDWDLSVVESMRALAAALVERGVVPDVPAATAHEVTGSAAPAFPALAGRLESAALVFDETRYGDRRATRDRALQLVGLDREMAGTAPDGGSRRGPLAAVPR